MARRVIDAQETRFLLLARSREGGVARREPIDRIARVLQQIRSLFLGERVGHGASELELGDRAKAGKGRIARAARSTAAGAARLQSNRGHNQAVLMGFFGKPFHWGCGALAAPEPSCDLRSEVSQYPQFPGYFWFVQSTAVARSRSMVKHEHLPHLRPIAQQPIVFLTVVTHRRRNCLLDSVALESLTTIFQRSTTYDDWFVGDFLLMPDHVHLFARATLDAKPLAHWVRTWKSLSARQISSDLRIPAPIWQRDYFDRFLRSADNYSEKWDYVAENPVRKNFCREAKDWRWKGRIHDLRD